MALIGLQNITKQFGGPPVLDDVTLHIERGERICLIGRNGEGKSTLMKLLAGLEPPDAGEIVRQAGVRVGFLPQEAPGCMDVSVRKLVAEGVGDTVDEWEKIQRVELMTGKMGLDDRQLFSRLSGGQKRRAMLARALVGEPDVLLLDEPTNHLDLESIEWMETMLLRYRGALLFVSHDRMFLQRLATRIVELDRGRLSSWETSYPRYLELRQEQWLAEEKHHALFDKKLAQEEAWIRQGIKARRTRNEGRVRALKALREERRQRRERSGTASIDWNSAALSGRKVIVTKGLSFSWDGQPVVNDLTVRIMRGDKIGLIGPNGCGKTTLLKLLLKQLAPAAGTVQHGTNLQAAFFDQHREALDEQSTVADNVSGKDTHVVINGARRHVLSYLQDFLFSPDRARTPVKALSGGERNRLLLAKLFTRPANVLVMDEPTNDLDLETLELLEALLVDFPGTVLLVSHDRSFLNDVVTSSLVFEGGGRVSEYVGGYDDWQAQRKRPANAEAPKPAVPAREAEEALAARPRKLSNREREELKALPAQIERLEAEREDLHRRIQDPEWYRRPAEEARIVASRIEQLPAEIEAAYARWHELEP